MVGGMTPPCAIALASLLFKDKFTKEEREAGPTNFIMGLAFITEGAIPLRHLTRSMYFRPVSSVPQQPEQSPCFELYTDGTTWRNLRISGCR